MKQSIGRFRTRRCSLFSSWRVTLGFLKLLSVMLLLPPLSLAQESESGSFLLDNVRVIVGDGSLLEQAAILVEEGRITAVGSRSDIEIDAGVAIIDLDGKTAMPALIDGHAHLGYEGHRSWGSENYDAENLIDHLQRYAYYGFSAVFSAGSDPDGLARAVQQARLRGEFQGARFLFGAGMAPPGQGPNDQFLSHALALEQQTGETILYGVADAEQAVAAVRRIAAKNIPVIKIWVDDRGGSQDKLESQLYRAIIREAGAHNIEVYAHQQYATDMPGLLDAGVTGFLHGRIGPDLDRNIAGQLSGANAFVIPNLGLAELRREAIGADPFLRESLPEVVAAGLLESGQRLLSPTREQGREEELRTSFGHLLAADVDILLGTDAGAVPNHFFGYSGHRELEIFVRLGMTPMQAIIAGTSKPAQRLGLADLGLLREGYSADIVILDENPLVDIRNTRTISSVYLDGRRLDRAGLAANFID